MTSTFDNLKRSISDPMFLFPTFTTNTVDFVQPDGTVTHPDIAAECIDAFGYYHFLIRVGLDIFELGE